MDLYVDTSNQKFIELSLKKGDKVVLSQKVEAYRAQSEKLIPGIDKLLKSAKIELSDIKNILVRNEGDSFSALRIGIVAANALGFAINKPVASSNKAKKLENKSFKFSIVEPKYSKEPNITVKKDI